MTPASHAGGPEFDSRSSYDYIRALLVQWLEFAVANGEARVRFSDSAMTAAADIILLESSWRDVSPAVPAPIFILAYEYAWVNGLVA